MTLFAIDALSVRELSENDLDDLFALVNKELVKKYIPDRFETPEELRIVLLWLIANYSRPDPVRLTYKICLGERLIGWISTGPLPSDETKREIAYALDPEYWARGYATKVAGLFVGHLRSKGMDEELFAEIDLGNQGSAKVVEKCGFEKMGHFQDAETGRQKVLYRLPGVAESQRTEGTRAIGPVRGINHITLSVRSIDSAFAFYRDVLGLRPVMKSRISAYFTAGPTWIALVEEKDAEPAADYGHICLAVAEEDFAAFVSKVRSAGVREWQENFTEGESLYLLDDSGNKLEIHYSTLENRIADLKRSVDEDITWF